MVFVDLEKAYDTLTREVLWVCMRKQKIPEGYIRLVQDMYQGATTRVKSKRGISEHFEVGIGLHQGSALSQFIFVMLVDTIYQDVRTGLPWKLLYADDIAIIDSTRTYTQNRLESWHNIIMLVSHCGEYMANGLTNAVRHEFVMIVNDRQTFVDVRNLSRSFLWCFECSAGHTGGECMANGLTNAIRHQFAMISK